MERNKKPRTVHEIIADITELRVPDGTANQSDGAPAVIQAGTGNVNIYAPGGLKLDRLPNAAGGGQR